MNNFDVNSIEGKTGQILAKQPKVQIIISKDHGPYWHGGINGYMFKIPTGVIQTVPRDIATLIKQNADVLERSAQETAEYQNDGKDLSRKT